MLKPLARLPEVVIVDRDGAAFAQAFPEALIIDRECLCLRQGHRQVGMAPRQGRPPRLFLLAAYLLDRSVPAEAGVAETMQAFGITDPHLLSLCLQQLRRALRPFGLGVENTRSGRIVICAPRPTPPLAPALKTRRAA